MKKRILVVENDAEILNVLNYLLKDEGFEVKTLRNVDDLIATITTFKPDAILLDVIVPGVEGTEVCRMIKSKKDLTHIPLIVLSTHPIVTATIKELCADEVVSKPFDINHLVEVISNQLAA
jgi:DNA-binding response OmpR family regulator